MKLLRWVASGSILFAAFACAGEEPPPSESGLDRRPQPLACQGFVDRPGPARVVRAYEKLTFEAPVQLVHHPTDPVWYVVEQPGTIRRFEDRPDVTHADVVFDVRSEISVDFERGLLGLAFDPRFAETGEVVVKMTVPNDKDSGRLVLARLRSMDGGRTFDPATMRTILEVDDPQRDHHGGPPAFGRDGHLYVPIGDGEYPLSQKSQDLTSLEGKFLRIDTRVEPYAIPPDNPFVSTPGVRPEIFAYGLRNPHGWSFDPEEPVLWVGDVGLHAWEEIDRVHAGSNCGWPIREGLQCLQEPECTTEGFVDPIYYYPNLGGAAIIGGPVYQGTKLSWVRGQIVFADFVTGRIQHVARGGGPATLLAESGINISSIAEDPDHEILLTEIGGRLHRVEPNPTPASPPALLSATGCVDMQTPLTPPEGMLPYDVNMPLWSDGVDKVRWLAVPALEKIHVLEDGDWELPIGTVAVKTFHHGTRPFETRLLVRHGDGDWAGYSYEWNEEGTDAVLLDEGKYEFVDGVLWTFPNRAQCMSCHTTGARRTLGLETAQMNRDFVYPGGRRANQMTTFAAIGMFDRDVGPTDSLPRFPARDDANVPTADWVRAYLHANCSHCHRPEGPVEAVADFTASSPLRARGCDVPPTGATLDTVDGRVIAPGRPEASLLFLRMGAEFPYRMPPLATSVVDDLALSRVRAWIMELEACD